MENILLLTDFSDNANNALDYGLQLFKGKTVNFYILNVQKVSKYTTSDLMSSSSSSVYDSIIKNPKASLSKLVEKLKIEYKNEDYYFDDTCDYDVFISAVKQSVDLNNIDLIIMGTNGATGAKEVIFGSNTLSVIRNIECPVLAIPEGFKFIEPNNILFATEVDEVFASSSLKPLIYIVSKFNSELQILILKNGINPVEVKKADMDVFFKETQHDFHTIINIPSDIAIDCFVQLYKNCLTAKIINKESFLKRLLKGSKTDEITYNSRVPLLIMHP